jgi:hypothetical protein
MEFDFDSWAKLAKEDPAAFERRRADTLRSVIEGAPPDYRQRLEGLQFRLNLERERSGTPLASCVRMNTLMWAGFHRLRKELMAATRGTEAGKPREDKRIAQVIPMRSAAERQK